MDIVELIVTISSNIKLSLYFLKIAILNCLHEHLSMINESGIIALW